MDLNSITQDRSAPTTLPLISIGLVCFTTPLSFCGLSAPCSSKESQRALYLSDQDKWREAATGFATAEAFHFRADEGGNALLAKPGRIRATIETRNLPLTSLALEKQLETEPLLKQDQRLSLFCLRSKGEIDCEVNARVTRKDWGQVDNALVKIAVRVRLVTVAEPVQLNTPGLPSPTSPPKHAGRDQIVMRSNLHHHWLKTVGNKKATEGQQTSSDLATERQQTGGDLATKRQQIRADWPEESDLRRSLRDGVSSSSLFCNLLLPCRHISRDRSRMPTQEVLQ
jgi:hypothetical protein